MILPVRKSTGNDALLCRNGIFWVRNTWTIKACESSPAIPA